MSRIRSRHQNEIRDHTMKPKLAVLKIPFNCPLISQVSELSKYSASQLLRHPMSLSSCMKGALVMNGRDRLSKAIQASGGKHHFRVWLQWAFSDILTEREQEFSEIQFSYQMKEELIFEWLPCLVCIWPHRASRAPDLMFRERQVLKMKFWISSGNHTSKRGKSGITLTPLSLSLVF